MTRFIAAGAALVLATATDAAAQVRSYYNPYIGSSRTAVQAYNPYLRGYTGYSTGYNFATGASSIGTGYSGLYGSSFNRSYANPVFGVGGYQTGFANPYSTGYQSAFSTPFSSGVRSGYADPFMAARQSSFVNPYGGGFNYNYGVRPW